MDYDTPDLIDAADVMLGKVGYSSAAEAVAHRKPFVYVRRDYFNEQVRLSGSSPRLPCCALLRLAALCDWC